MMYSNNRFFACMAALCAPRFQALAILIFLGAGGASFAVEEVEIVAPNILKVSLEGSDTDVFVNTRVQNELYVHPADPSYPWFVEVDMDDGDLGALLWDIHDNIDTIDNKLARLQDLVTNVVSQGRTLTHIGQYTQLSSENSTNLPAIKNALYYNDDFGNTESVAEILADIRDNGFSSGGFALGTAFTNFVSALSMYFPYRASDTNYSDIVSAMDTDSFEYAQRFGLMPLYTSFLFEGLPYETLLKDRNPGYPNSFYGLPIQYSLMRTRLFNMASRGSREASNVLSRIQSMRYDAYNTYQFSSMLSNLFYNANMLTWTNMQAAGISPNNFAMQWFDSYNTKFQNMLLEYGTLAAITNENKQQVQFARNWYDSYSPRIVLEYLLNSDFLNGTNTLFGTLEALDDKIDSYSLSKLPTFGMDTNSASIDMGVIQQNPDSGYAEKGDEIRQEKISSASYLNNGWTIFDTIQENYDDVIDVIISKVHDGSDGGAGGDLSVSHNGLSLRIAGLDTDYVDIPEQYIDFTLPSDAKDKISNFWALIKKCLEWGMWTWAFFACWGMLCDRDFKQSSPTILD